LEGLATEDVGIFNGHFINFKAIWNILCPFGIFFPSFGYPENLATLLGHRTKMFGAGRKLSTSRASLSIFYKAVQKLSVSKLPDGLF
jgi:hypothetical protein